MKLVRQKIYQHSPSYTHLFRYLEILDKAEKQTVKEQAIEQAMDGGNIITSADLLLKLDESERAQKMLVSRYKELMDCYYGSLTSLVSQFDKTSCLLASTACYRALLEDILNRGHSKSYSHAARYFKSYRVLQMK